MNRTCIDCGALVPYPRARCLTHERGHERARQARRGSLYDRAHQRRAREQITAMPWCGWCGRTDDLTADHVIAGDPASPLRTLCRSCNSTRANRARRRG